MRKLFLVVLLLGAGLVGAAWYLHQKRMVDTTVTQPFVEKDLTTDEIRAKMSSGDPKQVFEASKQLDKLEPEERLRVLLKLADDPQSPLRLKAAVKLKKIEDPRAKKKLAEMAAGDPDDDVRQAAGGNP